MVRLVNGPVPSYEARTFERFDIQFRKIPRSRPLPARSPVTGRGFAFMAA
ncbi:hypothetical protein ThrDRAFT_02518 [Frankia casuarinae]|nr:hypothetical protein CcI6DRAFT_03987 [Frankia sp. CcI6]EYT91873.1 hypothetical protein ThrDRAFT_02518 [Frankia casuarinae]KDA41307.1 hypothetical protein BMG523Draft_03850 [Frankia sp. BMG5.23]KEZ34848.1 hypothetical protein CEDDRAFT_03778 [Frankia sp. CeD]KFB03107.1 hypothetical protein ALLO2DRAFT_04146 [Frankia sp. Allo2]